MLGDLEARLAAIVAGVTGRPDLTVGAGPPLVPGAGEGRVAIALSSFTPTSGFSPGYTTILDPTTAPKSRRVLPVRLNATLAFLRRPSDDGDDDARNAARAKLLEDISAVAHLLADPSVGNGDAFATGGSDQGFRVWRSALTGGTSTAAPNAAGDLTGSLTLELDAEIWPALPPPSDEGLIVTPVPDVTVLAS
ncbi:hypothetical protein VW23_009450 [Devosia insulae DS-56]|uniref:Uncharacterized protein n=1 Tax=Devosia insulae DS-56 TaxID=1116389 RepID=A0A1E5XW95_9HYPH|nr:hypothetical protein [Devosia insulae]OEO32844.1 hypothetical protein VW23_009450 [Devosia insulae DS-56]